MLPKKLCSSNSADYSFGNMALVMGTVIAAIIPSIFLFADKDNIVVAVCIAVSVSVMAILALLVPGLFPTTASIYLLYFALIVVIFIPTLSSRRRSLLGGFGALDDLVGRFLPADNDLLAHRFLKDDGLRCLLTYDDGLWRGRFGPEVLG
jgi:hypothetical protein